MCARVSRFQDVRSKTRTYVISFDLCFLATSALMGKLGKLQIRRLFISFHYRKTMIHLWACINMLLCAACQKRKSAKSSRSNAHIHTHSLYVDVCARRLRMDHTLS